MFVTIDNANTALQSCRNEPTVVSLRCWSDGQTVEAQYEPDRRANHQALRGSSRSNSQEVVDVSLLESPVPSSSSSSSSSSASTTTISSASISRKSKKPRMQIIPPSHNLLGAFKKRKVGDDHESMMVETKPQMNNVEWKQRITTSSSSSSSSSSSLSTIRLTILRFTIGFEGFLLFT